MLNPMLIPHPAFSNLLFPGNVGRDIALRCPRPRHSGRNGSYLACAPAHSVPSPDAALGDGERRSAPSLPHQFRHQFAVNIRKSKIPPLKFKRQPLVIQPQQMEHRRV